MPRSGRNGESSGASVREMGRRGALKTIAAGSAIGVGILSTSGSAAAVDFEDDSIVDRQSRGTEQSSLSDPWYGRAEFSKGQIGQCVDLVEVTDSPYPDDDGQIYYFNAGTTASRAYYEQRAIWNDQEWTAEEFRDEAPGEGGYKNLNSFIEIENDDSDGVGLQIPDGSLGVGGSPSQLLYDDTTEQQAEIVASVAQALIGEIPMIGSVITASEIAGTFGTSDTKDIGDNEHEFTWKFGNWDNVPDDFDWRACSGFVQFQIRTPPDTTPEFSVRNQASHVGVDSIDIENSFKASESGLDVL